MYGARIQDEVVTGPGVAHEELDRQQLSLQSIATHTSRDDVPERMGASMRQRVNMVESRGRKLERVSAIHAAPAAVAHGGAFNCVFVVGCWRSVGATGM
jgi:hypothetical protein